MFSHFISLHTVSQINTTSSSLTQGTDSQQSLSRSDSNELVRGMLV